MANIDANRAAFVQQEYRYAVQENPAVMGRTGAREIVVDTFLDPATADAMAIKYLADNTKPRVLEIVLEGVIYPDTLIGGVPAFMANIARFATDGRTYKLMGFTTDYEANTTTVQVRG